MQFEKLYKVDKINRFTIPQIIRKKFNISCETELSISVVNGEIVIEKIVENVGVVGTVRTIDNLGRVVISKRLLSKANIKSGSNAIVVLEDNNSSVLKMYIKAISPRW